MRPVFITSPTLSGVTHGFFTRAGGASSGVFSGLNCGAGSSDQRDIVDLNRARAAQALGAEADQLITQYQVHSADVVTVRTARDRGETADAMVTNVPGLMLGVLTADCQPVLFADTHAQVVGAAHAGWKGAIDGVMEATIAAMETLGARRDRIHATIGPTISQAAYEVGPEFRDRFLEEDADNAQFFSAGAGDRFQFNLPAYGLRRLSDAGIATATWTKDCTYADSTRFYSYRRSVHQKEADYGRLISIIGL
ncbi:MAG: peptidoglycan editing factor PgeF [Pseudomonadota bacterium]